MHKILETKDDFAVHVGQRFTIYNDEVSRDAQLSEVDSLGHGERAGGAFSVLFTDGASDSLGQGNYTVTGPDGSETVIFIVPIGPRDGGFAYEAVFT